MTEQSGWWTRVLQTSNCFVLMFISFIEISPALVLHFFPLWWCQCDCWDAGCWNTRWHWLWQWSNSTNALGILQQHLRRSCAIAEESEDVNKPGNNSYTAFHWAASNNNTDVTRLLLEQGASKIIANRNGSTPTDVTCDYNKEGAVRQMPQY